MSEIYMMVTICNRKQMQKFVKFYKQNHVDTGNISLAMGTAASDVLDYFGLEEDEKGIHFCLVTRPTWKTVKKGLQTELKIDVPGTGIVFLIPLSSIGGKHQLKFMLGEQEFEKGEETTLKETKHELIIAIANYGYNTQVMRAAEEGGATGGTVFHGKGVGMKRAEQFLGVSLVSEKEIIFIVTKTEQKNAIMKSIMEKAGIRSATSSPKMSPAAARETTIAYSGLYCRSKTAAAEAMSPIPATAIKSIGFSLTTIQTAA